jgi:anti-sigma regulatory factor (Ser/Thr protein kinase)
MAVRALPGESVAGDECAVFRGARGPVAVLVDGLGHGAPASTAARAFVDVVRADCDGAIEEVFAKGHQALRTTRGAVAAVARFDERAQTVEFGALGNVTTVFFRRNDGRILPLTVPGVLGGTCRAVRVQTFPFGPGDVMLMHSDGVQSRFEVETLVEGSLAAVAANILRERAKPSDDAACLVAVSAVNGQWVQNRMSDSSGVRELRVCVPGDAECAARATRTFAMHLGLPRRAQWEASVAASDLATAALKLAHGCRLALRHVSEPREALVIEVTDDGNHSLGLGLGLGLGSVRRLMDEVQVDSRVPYGTTITVTKYVAR